MKKLLLLLCVLLTQIAIAQPRCGFDEIHKSLMAKDPNYKLRVDLMEAQWSQSSSNPNALRMFLPNNGVTYEIPVVVHIMHTGGAVGSTYNPTDAAINSMLNYLNQTYAAQFGSYPDSNSGGV
jgi:hypothetical protein